MVKHFKKDQLDLNVVKSTENLHVNHIFTKQHSAVIVECVIMFALPIVADGFGMFLQPYCTKPGFSPFRTAGSLNYSLL